MKVRYQADNDLSQIIVKATIRLEPMIDFKTAHAAGLSGLDDLTVLTRAAADRRILVSHDLKTMPHHFATFIQSAISPGVLLVPQGTSLTGITEDLLLIWLVDDAQDWINRIRILPL